jgi:hypothetical protein
LSDRKEELVEEAKTLAKATETKLRGVIWRAIIENATEDEALSNGALILVGAMFALIIPNLRDLFQVFDLVPLKAAFVTLLSSAVLGLMAKAAHRAIKSKIDTNESDRRFEAIYLEYAERLKTLSDEATAFGVEIGDTLDLREIVKPLDSLFPGLARWAIKRLRRGYEKSDPDRNWRSAYRRSLGYTFAVGFQLILLIAAVLLLLINLKRPGS